MVVLNVLTQKLTIHGWMTTLQPCNVFHFNFVLCAHIVVDKCMLATPQ